MRSPQQSQRAGTRAPHARKEHRSSSVITGTPPPASRASWCRRAATSALPAPQASGPGGTTLRSRAARSSPAPPPLPPRRRHLGRRASIPSRCACSASCASARRQSRVHQFADRDGDATERHNVRRDPHRAELDERHEPLTGIVISGMSALGTCHRNSSTMKDTVSTTSTSVSLTVSIARRMSAERS